MLTMTAALRRTRRLHAGNTAIRHGEGSFTWAEWVERISRVATVLREAGIQRGDRYALLALNSFRQAELIHAGYWCGAIPVPINFRLAPPEIRHILDDAGCRTVFADPMFAEQFNEAPLKDWNGELLVRSPRDHDDELAAAAETPPANCAEQDEAILLYTGGTSGRAKGVPLSHRNIVSNAMQVSLAWPGSFSATVLHVAPMFHAADLVLTPFTLHGGAHAFLPQFTPEALFNAIQTHRVSATLLVPTMIAMALDAGIVDDYDLDSLRYMIYGTASMSPALIERVTQILPNVQLTQGYGLTETAPILTFLDHPSHQDAIARGDHERLKSCGRPLIGIDLEIIDDDGNTLAADEPGEIVARGPNIFSGYLNLRYKSDEVLADDRFHTGDIGRIDEDGYLYILDRKQNLIITGGENVYSGEVEDVLLKHEAIAEAAVIGIPDEKYGELVCAVVVPKSEQTIDPDELLEFCRGEIGGYKLPRRVETLEALPKSAVGKVLKRELRDRFAQ